MTRDRLIAICSKIFKLVGSNMGGMVNVYEMPDSTKYSLTSQSGMAESISLKSPIWNYTKCADSSLSVIKDTNGRNAYFSIDMDGKNVAIKHSSVPKVILKEDLNDDDILDGYPPMLPNSSKLDLSYAVDIDIEPAPQYWID